MLVLERLAQEGLQGDASLDIIYLSLEGGQYAND